MKKTIYLNTIYIMFLAVVMAFLISACATTTKTDQGATQVAPQNTPPVQETTTPVENNTTIVKQPESYVDTSTSVEPTLTYSGNIIAGTTDPYIEFNQADFDKAVAAKKLVLLYFYDKDNPICKVEEVAAVDAFKQLDIGKIVGFRVHITDGLATSDELAIAQKYGAKDSFKLVIKNGQVVDKGIFQWENANTFVTTLRTYLD